MDGNLEGKFWPIKIDLSNCQCFHCQRFMLYGISWMAQAGMTKLLWLNTYLCLKSHPRNLCVMKKEGNISSCITFSS